MSAGKSVQDILAGAKATLAHADNFTKSIEGPKKAEPLPAPKVQHEFSKAPYTLIDEAKSAGEGIKARMENEAKVRAKQ